MAEGWARELLFEECDPYSAGTDPQTLNPYAVRVMKECGVDISDHYPKTLASLSEVSFDLVVAVCESAAKSCPRPPTGARVIHAPFDDPPRLAETAASEEAALNCYRRVRDEIKEFVVGLSGKIRSADV